MEFWIFFIQKIFQLWFKSTKLDSSYILLVSNLWVYKRPEMVIDNSSDQDLLKATKNRRK